jgi:branched-chain amino acid transport system permease protein
LDLYLAVAIGGATSVAVALLIGRPVLRLQGIYFVMVTLAFGEVTRTFFQNFEPTGGAYGMRGMYGVTLEIIYGVVVVVVLLFLAFDLSRAGRLCYAVRDDDEAARSVGINIVAVRLAAFAWGALIAGIAGALFAHYALYIESSNFNFMISASAVLFVILGGVQTFWGAIIGAVVFTILPEGLRFLADWRLTAYGAILVLMMVLRPEGMITLQSLRRARRMVIRA